MKNLIGLILAGTLSSCFLLKGNNPYKEFKMNSYDKFLLGKDFMLKITENADKQLGIMLEDKDKDGFPDNLAVYYDFNDNDFPEAIVNCQIRDRGETLYEHAFSIFVDKNEDSKIDYYLVDKNLDKKIETKTDSAGYYGLISKMDFSKL